MKHLSLEKDKIRILLLEGVHQSAVEMFESEGYTNITLQKEAMNEDELLETIANVHVLGIRSRTQLTEEVFKAAKKLFAVGCFCIGTNNTNLKAARERGIPVFNAPFSSTRSVAEVTIAHIINLLRGIPAKNIAMHMGKWQKSSKDAHEVRWKTLGIVGYGRIGMQVGILAEALGMQVYFYDVEEKLTMGNARQVASFDELLKMSDVVSLHVPHSEHTKNMIGSDEIAKMKRGSYLINTCRGQVVDIEALASTIKSGHLKGAAVDVFPSEPKSKDEEFVSELREFDNVILTPHISGSTEEAQVNIGKEVAAKLIRYSDNGSTLTAVNFVELDLPDALTNRILHIHKNQPGVLSAINDVFSRRHINVIAQHLRTDSETGYAVIDIDNADKIEEAKAELKNVEGTIRTRVLY